MEASKTLIDRALKVCKTPYQLSKLTGTSQGNLSEMLHGKRPIPPTLAGQLAALVGDDPREAALQAIVDSEKNEEKRERIARILQVANWRRR